MADLTKPEPEFGYYEALPEMRRKFVDEYLVDLNGRAAARRAGYKQSHDSYRLLNAPDVIAAIKEIREKTAVTRTTSGAEFVLNSLWDIATADARELIAVHRVPCRYCWGVNGQYQFTKTEMDRLVKAHDWGCHNRAYETLWPRGDADKAYYTAGTNDLPFDPQGGDGYTHNRDPNPECSECHGNGTLVNRVADSRKLSAQARQLYRGLKVRPDGIEVLMSSQDEARNMLARHYNVGTERKQLLVEYIDPRKLSDDELIRATAEAEAMLVEIETERETHQHVIIQAQQKITNRHSRELTLARARVARFAKGQEMVKRPRG